MTEPTDSDVRSVLRRWLDDERPAELAPLTAAGSFSGAALWRVVAWNAPYVLRRWPRSMTPQRLAAIHGLQEALARGGAPVPRPLPVLRESITVLVDRGDEWFEHQQWAAYQRRATLVVDAGAVWELADWRPGDASYWRDPRPAKLAAAMTTLARLHVAAAAVRTPDRAAAPADLPSPALAERRRRLQELQDHQLDELRRAAVAWPAPHEQPLIRRTVELLRAAWPHAWAAVVNLGHAPLPVQWTLRDIWHDHVLFTGDAVTGIVDFGAAAVDSPAGDVARLTGSLVGDDPDRRRQALDAYQSVRPLAHRELSAVAALDLSGTVLAAANWVGWLQQGVVPAARRDAALERLERLVERLAAAARRPPAMVVE